MTVFFSSTKNSICGYLYENAENKTQNLCILVQEFELKVFLVEGKKTVTLQIRVYVNTCEVQDKILRRPFWHLDYVIFE